MQSSPDTVPILVLILVLNLFLLPLIGMGIYYILPAYIDGVFGTKIVDSLLKLNSTEAEE